MLPMKPTVFYSASAYQASPQFGIDINWKTHKANLPTGTKLNEPTTDLFSPAGNEWVDELTNTQLHELYEAEQQQESEQMDKNTSRS